MPSFSLVVDSGASCSILQPASAGRLTRRDTVPGVTIRGTGGFPQPPVGTGFLDISFPDYVPPLHGFSTLHAPASASPGSNVCYVIPSSSACPPLHDYAPTSTSPALLASTTTKAVSTTTTAAPLASTTTPAASTTTSPVYTARASAVPPHRTAASIAQRLNVFSPAALRLVHTYLDGVMPLTVSDDVDYAKGLSQLALHRRPPTHFVMNQLSSSVRDHQPPGSVWWTDISHSFPPDFEGNTYARLFAEDRTSFAIEHFCSDKGSATLVSQLVELKAWVKANVPGGALHLICCDFGSEYAKQGHGDDILTRACSEFCDANPEVRIRPVPLPPRPVPQPRRAKSPEDHRSRLR